MLKKYFLNFWIWWYGVNLFSVFRTAYSLWSLSLANLNILPMFANLFVPMYQDQTLVGKFMSFLLRLFWIGFGALIQILLTIPLLCIILLWLTLPFVCLIQMFRFLI